MSNTERVKRICTVCAALNRLRWAVVDGACEEHREHRHSDREVTIELIVAEV